MHGVESGWLHFSLSHHLLGQVRGHFGGSGTFLWVDPELGIACAALTTRDFGDWAKEAWPRLSDEVVAALA